MINIVFTGGFFYPYGMASTMRVQHLMDGLNRNNFQTKVLLIKNSADNIKKYGIKGNYKRTEYYVAKNKKCFFLTYLKSFKFISVSKVPQGVNFLYVYNNINIENIFLVLFAKILNYRIIVDIVEDFSVHSENISFKKKLNLKSTFVIERFYKSIVDGIVVISTYLKIKHEKMYNGKIPIILIPVSAYIRDTILKKPTSSNFIFAYSGSFGNKDGIPGLIKAFNLLTHIYADVELHMSGIGNNAEFVVKNALNDRIKYVGYLEEEDYYKFIRNADVLCMTRTNSAYSNAGFPFKLGEYLASGNPVIASDISDISMYLENMKDVLLIKPDSINELFSAMKFLIENKKEGRKIGQNGQNKCKQFFSPSSNGEKLTKFIQSL
jgi:glycosyltransferase involved in cell wall biosynthesis